MYHIKFYASDFVFCLFTPLQAVSFFASWQNGTLQPVKGVLPIALRAREEGFKGVIVPLKNAMETAVVGGLDVYGMENLSEVVDFFNGTRKFSPVKVDLLEMFASEANKYDVDFSDVRGQENVKRALEVAAAGGHNIIILCTN